jgi:hypothetical protein
MERARAPTLAELAGEVRHAHRVGGRDEALRFWSRHLSGVTGADVLGSLSQRMFGLRMGSDLAQTLAGPTCCNAGR